MFPTTGVTPNSIFLLSSYSFSFLFFLAEFNFLLSSSSFLYSAACYLFLLIFSISCNALKFFKLEVCLPV